MEDLCKRLGERNSRLPASMALARAYMSNIKSRPTGRPAAERGRLSRSDCRDDFRGRIVAGDHLQRRQIRQIAVRIRLLIDGDQPLGQIAHGRAGCGIVRRCGRVKFELGRSPGAR